MTGLFKQVAELPIPRQPINRSVKNPLDKSTIVSIIPRKIIERKHTIEPGIFEIPPGSYDNPSVLVVGSSSWFRHIADHMPDLEIPVSSISVAEAVIRDFCNSTFGWDGENQSPGLFFAPGQLSQKEIKEKYSKKLEEIRDKQFNWFNFLFGAAESLWARSNGNPLAISDDMRMAAFELGKKDRPWLLDFNKVQLVACAACGTLKNPAFPVCNTCRAIDMNHPSAKDLQFAKS